MASSVFMSFVPGCNANPIASKAPLPAHSFPFNNIHFHLLPQPWLNFLPVPSVSSSIPPSSIASACCLCLFHLACWTPSNSAKLLFSHIPIHTCDPLAFLSPSASWLKKSLSLIQKDCSVLLCAAWQPASVLNLKAWESWNICEHSLTAC